MNAHIDPAVFERCFERAIREHSSMPCPYPDWDNPANWEQYTGNPKNIPDGEVVLVFREGAMGAYAFRQYVALCGREAVHSARRIATRFTATLVQPAMKQTFAVRIWRKSYDRERIPPA